MRKGIRGCQESKAPLASRENRVPLAPLALWATLGPKAWWVLQDRKAQRGPQDPKVLVETPAPQVLLVPRVPLRSCMGCAGADVPCQAWGPRRAAWRRCWPRWRR